MEIDIEKRAYFLALHNRSKKQKSQNPKAAFTDDHTKEHSNIPLQELNEFGKTQKSIKAMEAALGIQRESALNDLKQKVFSFRLTYSISRLVKNSLSKNKTCPHYFIIL